MVTWIVCCLINIIFSIKQKAEGKKKSHHCVNECQYMFSTFRPPISHPSDLISWLPLYTKLSPLSSWSLLICIPLLSAGDLVFFSNKWKSSEMTNLNSGLSYPPIVLHWIRFSFPLFQPPWMLDQLSFSPFPPGTNPHLRSSRLLFHLIWLSLNLSVPPCLPTAAASAFFGLN